MLSGPFLTEVDSRATVKGSRDPLGVQPIWTRLGRHVVGNLTTVSNSVCDFSTLLLGYYFTEQVAAEVGPGLELATFLKWEQLAAYARGAVNEDWIFRGTERVRKALSDDSRVTLSADKAYQILGNQKIYGLWGLYTVPARASGLLEGDPPRLTPVAREFTERYWLKLLAEEGFRDGRRIVELLVQPQVRIDVRGTHASLLRAVARLLPRRLRVREREFYRFHLLHGGPQEETQGLQQRLSLLLERTLSQSDFAWSPPAVAALAREARAKGEDWHPLAWRLERIRVCEALLAPMTMLFVYLLGLDGKSLGEAVQRLREAWGPSGPRTLDLEAIRELRAEMGEGAKEVGDRWVAIAEAAAQGEYAALIEALCDQNRWVMAARGGAAPWLEKREGRLHVRFRDERGELPQREELPMLWRYSYFLDSLRAVAYTLKED
jgi:hypothetical protein